MELVKLRGRTAALLGQMEPLNFVFLFLAGVVNAIGVTIFIAPVQLYDSGISGTSILLSQLTPEYLSLSFFLPALHPARRPKFPGVLC